MIADLFPEIPGRDAEAPSRAPPPVLFVARVKELQLLPIVSNRGGHCYLRRIEIAPEGVQKSVQIEAYRVDGQVESRADLVQEQLKDPVPDDPGEWI